MTNKPGEFQQPARIGSHEMELMKQAKREALDQLWREEEEKRAHPKPRKASK